MSPMTLRQRNADALGGFCALTSCTVRRHTNVYEVVSEAIEPLWRMMPEGEGWPLLLDRRAKLVPSVDGYPMPDFFHWLLLPFSERKVSTWDWQRLSTAAQHIYAVETIGRGFPWMIAVTAAGIIHTVL